MSLVTSVILPTVVLLVAVSTVPVVSVVLVCASSFKNYSIPKETLVIGEVGLTGEVRAVNLIDKRLKEAEKLGFKTCIIPKSNKKLLKEKYKLDIIGVGNINEAMKAVGLK